MGQGDLCSGEEGRSGWTGDVERRGDEVDRGGQEEEKASALRSRLGESSRGRPYDGNEEEASALRSRLGESSRSRPEFDYPREVLYPRKGTRKGSRRTVASALRSRLGESSRSHPKFDYPREVLYPRKGTRKGSQELANDYPREVSDPRKGTRKGSRLLDSLDLSYPLVVLDPRKGARLGSRLLHSLNILNVRYPRVVLDQWEEADAHALLNIEQRGRPLECAQCPRERRDGPCERREGPRELGGAKRKRGRPSLASLARQGLPRSERMETLNSAKRLKKETDSIKKSARNARSRQADAERSVSRSASRQVSQSSQLTPATSHNLPRNENLDPPAHAVVQQNLRKRKLVEAFEDANGQEGMAEMRAKNGKNRRQLSVLQRMRLGKRYRQDPVLEIMARIRALKQQQLPQLRQKLGRRMKQVHCFKTRHQLSEAKTSPQQRASPSIRRKVQRKESEGKERAKLNRRLAELENGRKAALNALIKARKSLQKAKVDLIMSGFRDANKRVVLAARLRRWRKNQGQSLRRREATRKQKARQALTLNVKARIYRYCLDPVSRLRGEHLTRMRHRQLSEAALARQRKSHQEKLRKEGGKQGYNQPGTRAERLKKETRFRTALVNRITRVTQAKVRFNPRKMTPAVVDMNAQLNEEVRKEVALSVERAIELKRQELKAFLYNYMRLLGIANQCETMASSGAASQEKVVENILRARPNATHRFYQEARGKRRPRSAYEVEVKNSKTGMKERKRQSIPCTDDCTLPKEWQRRMWELLEGLQQGTFDVFRCMESLMDFEHCEGCVEFTDQCTEEGGCKDGVKLLLALRPHSLTIRNLLDGTIYPARRAMRSVMELDAVLTDASCDLRALQSRTGELEKRDAALLAKVAGGSVFKKASRPGPPISSLELAERWGEHEKAFKDIEKDHPLKACPFCDELKRPNMFRGTVKDLKKVKPENLGRAQSIIWETFPEAMTAEQRKMKTVEHLFPFEICKHCWELVRMGQVGGGMKVNAMGVAELPQELAQLNLYENFLIARAHAFYSVVTLKPMGKAKLPPNQMLKATKGSAIHLPIPVANTANKVLDTLPMQAPEDVLQIYADVPTNSGVTWRNLVDVEKVLKALVWLKANNKLYKDIIIRPEMFDQMDARGFMSLTGAEVPAMQDKNLDAEAPSQPEVAKVAEEKGTALVPQAEQHVLEGEYSVQTTHDAKIKAGEDLETYIQMRVEGTPLPTQEKHLDALCLPAVYPTGEGNLEDESRERKLRPAEFYSHRLRHKSGRFRRHLRFMHQAHFLKRDRAINQGIFASTKTGSGFGKQTAGQLLKRIKEKDIQLENDLAMCMRTVKGTKEYWGRQASDLACMDEQLGPATWFLTLSCAEYNWPEMEDYIRKVNKDLPGVEKMSTRELMASDPAVVSEFFYRRFQGFLKEVLLADDGPLGEVEHYYWRLEYQARGAPHIHMKLWSKDAPIIGVNTEKEVLDYISQHITCAIPNALDNPELRKTVERYQMHKCTKSCQKYKPRMKAMKCRYGFPRASSDDYSLTDLATAVKSRLTRRGKARKMYELPRTEDERYVNDYNPAILSMWQANMDLQFVGEKSRVLNSYITSYVTKAEKNETEHIWAQLDSDKSISSRLKSLAHSSFRDREVGSYEIADELLGNHLHGSSDSVVWLGLGFSANRKRKAKSMKELEQLDAGSTKTTAESLIDNYYADRSEDLEDKSLNDMLVWYNWARGSKVGFPNKKIKGGFSAKRNQEKTSILVKTPYVACRPEQAELFFHNLLQQFVPHREEVELLRGKSSWVEAFSEWEEEYPALKVALERKQQMQAAKDLIARLEDEAAKENDEAQAASQAAADTAAATPTAIKSSSLRTRPGFATPEGLATRVAGLNEKQKSVYDEVMADIEHQEQHRKKECTCGKEPKQVLKFISGGAGVGKSKLIETLAEGVETKTGEEAILAAPTGLAAQNIDGRTLHKIFNLGVQDGAHWEYKELTHEAEKTMHAEIGKAPLLIIDEISMVSNIMLYFVNQRLQDLKQTSPTTPFGGYNVVVLGDLLQLPPVNAPYCFEPMAKDTIRKSFPGSRAVSMPVDIWGCFSYAELTQNMRQNKDKTYADILNKLRVGEIAGVEELDARKVPDMGSTPEEIAELLLRLQKEGKTPVCLLALVETVLAVNVAMLVAEGISPSYIFAIDESRNQSKKAKQKKAPSKDATPGEILKFVKENTEQKANKTGGLSEVLVVGEGSRVMLSKNIDLEAGLYNGAMGIVTRLVRSDRRGREVMAIEVTFDNGVVYEVERSKTTYKIGQAIEVKREQFPLSLAYAITIHKSQGLSLDCVVTDLGTDIFSSGMAYVTLSRVKTLAGLYLFALTKENVWCDLKSIAEYNRLRKAFEPTLGALVCAKRSKPMKKKALKRTFQQANLDLDQAFIATPTPTKKAKKKQQQEAKRAAPSGEVAFVPLYRAGHARNRCFCNTAVQVLLASEHVRDLLEQNGSSEAALAVLRPLLAAQKRGERQPQSTDDVVELGARLAITDGYQHDFADGQQQDSLDFLTHFTNGSSELKKLFAINVRTLLKCLNCQAVERLSKVEQRHCLNLERPLEAKSVAFGTLYKCEEEVESRCPNCSPPGDVSEAANRLHAKRVEVELREGAKHLLVKIQLHGNRRKQDGSWVLDPNGDIRAFKSKAKVSGFKAQGFKIRGANMRTDAAVVKEGDSLHSGHYYAVTRGEGGRWLKKNDGECTQMSRFVTNLQDVYYVLMTKM